MAPRLLLALLAVLPGACSGGRDDAAALRRAFAEARAELMLAGTGEVVSPPSSTRPAWHLAPAADPTVPAAGPVLPGSRPAAVAQLLGARPDAVRRWLGEPSLRRIEGTAEVWLYAGAACALDLVLYPDRDGLGVAHAAARANGTEPRTEASCLGELGRGAGLVADPVGAPARDVPVRGMPVGDVPVRSVPVAGVASALRGAATAGPPGGS